MRKIVFLCFFGVLLITISCESNCEGCGPTGYTEYYMINATNKPVTLTWFGNATLSSNVADEFTIPVGEKVLLYESGLGLSLPPSTARSIISRSPFGNSVLYDSVKIASTSLNIIYDKNNCKLSNNPLCEENYQLIKMVDTKEQQIKEWEFTIR